MDAIQVQNVNKIYKNGVKALDNLSLTIKKGEIFSLLGQNGAGKSTLIHILTTLLKAESGIINVLGKDIFKHSAFVRSTIACVSQRISLDTNLSLEENMLFQSELYRVPKKDAKKRITRLIEVFELEPYLKYPVSSYSGGIKRRLDIAMNMMSNPQILFLDEPTVGMDIQSRKAMWKIVEKIRDDFGTTIFLTTHYLEEADKLSDTICIIRDGHEVIQGTPLELKQYLHQNILKITLSTEAQAKVVKEQLVNEFRDYKIKLNKITIFIEIQDSSKDLQLFTSFLINNKIQFSGIEISQPSLEDIFLKLTQEEEVNS